MTSGRSTVALTNVGPGFELLALGIADTAFVAQLERAGAHAAAKDAMDTAAPDAAAAAAHVVDQLVLGASVPAPRVRLRCESRLPHVASDVTAAAAAAAWGVTAWLVQHDAPAPSAATLVRVVALTEQRFRGLPRPAAARCALFGGMAVATELHPPSARSSAAAPWHVAVCTPEVEVPRTALKAALPNGVPLMKAVRHAARSHALVAALRAGDADAARAAFEDAIVEPVLGELFTGAHPALRGARRAGAVGAWMHANGPTLCALAPSADAAEAAAEAIVAALDAHATRCTRSVYPVAPLRDEGQGA